MQTHYLKAKSCLKRRVASSPPPPYYLTRVMKHAMLLCHFASVILKELQRPGTDDVTGQSNMALQSSPGIRWQSLALGNESSSHTTKLLWKNSQETRGRDINKSVPATPPSCQMLSSQQKQMILGGCSASLLRSRVDALQRKHGTPGGKRVMLLL